MSESKRPRQGGSGPDRRRGRPDQRPQRRTGQADGPKRPRRRHEPRRTGGRPGATTAATTCPTAPRTRRSTTVRRSPTTSAPRTSTSRPARRCSPLPEKLAERVSRHLVMAGLLMQDDPETAYLHALAARARASRNGLIREACGETAYAAGKFAEALSEFRAARRMNGQQYYAPMMADCERALGRPEKALGLRHPRAAVAARRRRPDRAVHRRRRRAARPRPGRGRPSAARDRATAQQVACRVGRPPALRLRRHAARRRPA